MKHVDIVGGNFMKGYVISYLVGVVIGATVSAHAGSLDETRYCGQPKRTTDGEILRKSSVARTFQTLHPCPSTKLSYGPCQGWQKDHIIPLASCGCDSVSNMQWLPTEIKTCKGSLCKDRWERTIYRCP